MNVISVSSGKDVCPHPGSTECVNNVEQTPSTPTKNPKSKASKNKVYTFELVNGTDLMSYRNSLFSYLLTISLVYLVYHAFTACPSDYTLSSPYRSHILEPYVLRPLQHPALTPYISKAQNAERALRPYTKRAVAAGNNAVAKTWQGVVKPTYRKVLLPRYVQHVHPYVRTLQQKAHPYVAPAQKALDNVKPFIALVKAKASLLHAHALRLQPHIHSAIHTIRPYILSFIRLSTHYAQEAWTLFKRFACQAWKELKPRLVELWRVVKPHLYNLRTQIVVQVENIVDQAGGLRRQYVDPHILRIWEKVADGSASSFSHTETIVPKVKKEAENKITPPPAMESHAEVDEQSTHATIDAPSSASSIILASAHGSEHSGPAALIDELKPVLAASSPVVSTTPTLVPTFSASAATEFTSASQTEGNTDSITATETLSSVASILSASLHPTTSSTAVPASQSEIVSSETINSAASVISASLHVPSPVEEVEEEDLDDFLREIGLSDVPTDPAQPDDEPELESNTEVVEATPSLSPAEITRQKRISITTRHARWAQELDDLVREKRREVRRSLVRVREGAVAELAALDRGERPIRAETDGQSQGIVGGEKLLKGLEGYTRKAIAKINDATKDVEAEQDKFEKVAEKVEIKFGDKIREIRGDVHQWYMGVREREASEVLQAGAEVKLFAERAQADIGLDYAWLDDVTYDDWQRYHDLMRTYEKFDGQIRSMQNGTHPSPPADPLIPALDELERDMQDVIAGFQARVRTIRGEIESAFTARSVDEDPSDTPEPADDVTTASDADEPRVSILPIDLPGGAIDPELQREHAFIGRGREEVMEAMDRAGEGVSDETGTSPAAHVEL
ncbi:hypothetical protein BD779DRAFT_1549903 [Infundibulicybe gibba]|nr:hypothetical protein BD779DRAFT_1549903 [Infundibulicybe gibba]